MSKILKRNNNYYVKFTDNLARCASFLSCENESMIENDYVIKFQSLIEKDFKYKPKHKPVKPLIVILCFAASFGFFSVYFLSYWLSLVVSSGIVLISIFLSFFANRIKKPNQSFSSLIPILLLLIGIGEIVLFYFFASRLLSSFAIIEYYASSGELDTSIVNKTELIVKILYLISTIVPLITSSVFSFLSKKKASSICCLGVSSLSSLLFMFFINMILSEDMILERTAASQDPLNLLYSILLVVGICIILSSVSLVLMIDSRRSENE